MAAAGEDLAVWYKSPDALDAWLETAAPGDRFEYAHTPLLTQSAVKYPVVERVAELASEGEVRPHLNRNGVGCHYFVIRTEGAMPEAPKRQSRKVASLLSDEERRMLAAVWRATGRPCPTNASLAQAAQLPRGKDHAAYVLEKLRRAGLILIETHGAGLRRIIHVRTGKATAVSKPPAPPKPVRGAKKGKRK